VRLVGPNGEQVGIVRVEDALRLAQEADLDLVEVAPDARPPVCKLMDFGKFKYEADMKAREARRNQANTVLKEIRFRLKIDPHDYGTKKGHVERFLKAGDKVKIMIMFRGREQSRPEMGMRLLQRLADDVAELGFVESTPRQDGRNMIMVLGPTKKKSEAKHVVKRRDPRPDAPAGSEQASAEAEFATMLEQVEAEAAAEESALAAETAAAETAAADAADAQPTSAEAAEPLAVADAEPPTPDAPKVAPKVEAPAVRAPKVEAPAAVSPTTDAPKAVAPKAAPASSAVSKAAPAAPKAAPAPSAAPASSATPKPAVPKPGMPKPAPPKPSVAPKPATRAPRPASAAARPSTRKPPPGAEPESS
jgi:translation initiation factor IF-3